MARNEFKHAVKEASRLTRFDRIARNFAPRWVARRQQARIQTAMVAGYTGASTSRRTLSQFVTNEGDADAETIADLPKLRQRSSDLIRNDAIASGIINTDVSVVIGSGLKVQSRIDRDILNLSDEQADAFEANAERIFRRWGNSQECDIERTLHFADFQELVFRSVKEKGDILVLLPFLERTGSDFGVKVQAIEAERLSNENNVRDSNRLVAGVEKDEYGAPFQYHIASIHPGNRYKRPTEWKKVRAFGDRTGRRNALHIYHKNRVGLTRGVPSLAPVIEVIKQMSRYTEAEITAAVTAGLFTVFIESDHAEGLGPMEPTSQTGAKSSDDDVKMGSGAIVELGRGERPNFADPNRPNSQFGTFIDELSKQIGASLQIPAELLFKKFSTSYTAAQAALLEAWRYVLAERRWFVDFFCQPVYEAVIEEAVMRGMLSAPGFMNDDTIRRAYLGTEWIGPPKGHYRELEAAKAAQARVAGGFSTESRETIQMTGSDWERDHRQRVKEKNMKEEDGLTPEDTSGENAIADGDTFEDSHGNRYMYIAGQGYVLAED